ncbi:MAG: PQQ-binding-like beta-propeller repeat protein [Thermoguttaceae bacterium]
MKQLISFILLTIVWANSIINASAADPVKNDWPRFRGPTGDGQSPAKGIPTTWSKDQNVLWKADLPKAYNPYASPIVSGGKVFVATAGKEPSEHKLLCFNLADGKPVWETAIPPGPKELKDLRAGYNCPTPCTDGERVYVTFGSCALTAVDFQGKVVWRKPLETNFQTSLGTSPILYKDLVIQVCDTQGPSSILAFDRKTGDVKYQEPRPDGTAWGTPILVTFKAKTVMILKANKKVQGVDPENGKVLWTATVKHESMASPVYGAGLVYSDTGWGGEGCAVAVDAESAGDITKNIKWKLPGVAKAFCSPVFVGGTMYRFDSDDGGTLRCVDLATGKLLNTLDLPRLSDLASPVVTADGYIYFATGGKSYVVKPGPTPEIVSTNDLGDAGHSSAAVVEGRLIIRGNSNLWCIGKP